MSFSAEQPVWALVNKSTQTFDSTKNGIRTFETRTAARKSRDTDQKVVKLSATESSYSYR